MKKLIGTVAVAAMLATAAFAEISFGAWLRTMIMPVSGDGDDVKAFMSNSWYNNVRPARLDITGVTENEKAGMRLQFFPDNLQTDNMIGDNAYMWVKPWDWIRLSAGKMGDGDTGLRGDFCYGSWQWLRAFNGIRGDEGFTFSDIGGIGARLELFPVEGLTIVAFVPYPQDADKAYKVYEGTDVAVAYTIGDIGRVKAQWLGDGSSVEFKGKDQKHFGDIEVAFDLTAVENFYLTVGAKVGIMNGDYLNEGSETTYKLTEPKAAGAAMWEVDKEKGNANLAELAVVALGASYNIFENFKISLAGGVQFFNEAQGMKADPRWSIGLGLDYGFTDTLKLTADVRYISKLNTNSDAYDLDDSVSFLVGLEHSFSTNVVWGIGFEGVTNGYGFAGGNLADGFAWAVPVKIQLSL